MCFVGPLGGAEEGSLQDADDEDDAYHDGDDFDNEVLGFRVHGLGGFRV